MISQDIRYIGVNDHQIDLFESQYHVPNGMAYNSYAIVDEKTAIIDSVDARFTQEWFDHIQNALDGKAPDYLIIQHMEPDHSGSLRSFFETYPSTKIVASERAFSMMKNFFQLECADRQVIVGDGDTLSLGQHELTFIAAAMIHWPEVTMTYDATAKVLFSADAFGKFGALDVEEEWADEARRYYIGIVGKYGVPVQGLLKKAQELDIQTICPLHGPVLNQNLSYYLDLYNTWSSYTAEEDGIMIAYTSVYGNTKKAVLRLVEKLKERGCKNVVAYDLARTDAALAVAEAFRYSKLVLATTTYNNDIFPFMREFIEHLTLRGFTNRTVAFVENGSWAPAAARVMKGLLEKSKNLTYMETVVTLHSSLNCESAAQLEALAEELCTGTCTLNGSCSSKKKFVCKICGYIFEGEALPENFTCPICKTSASNFEEMKD